MTKPPTVLAEEHGIIDGCLTLCILKTTSGYVVGAHIPRQGEPFAPFHGQRQASANAYERLAANKFVEETGLDA